MSQNLHAKLSKTSEEAIRQRMEQAAALSKMLAQNFPSSSNGARLADGFTIVTEHGAVTSSTDSPSSASLSASSLDSSSVKADGPQGQKRRGIEIIDINPWNHGDSSLYDPELSELNLTNLRIRDMPTFADCKQLQKLVLRQNLIHAIVELPAHVASTLEELDFYENQIERIEHIQNCVHLRWLDLSFNQIRTLENLETLSDLKELYLVNNKISEIPTQSGLQSLTQLRLLELGANRIREISKGLSSLQQLEELWLGRNKISNIQNLESLANLRKLSFQSNRLTSIGSGLRCCTQLTELYLSHNGITKIDGLDTLARLKVLDLSNNQIEKIEGLDTLNELEEFWINHNRISSFDDLQCLTSKANLITIYLEGNPVAQDVEYKKKVLSRLPHLQQLDWQTLV